MEITKELITPLLAEKYLQANISNRRVKINVVTQYANDMANGRWKPETYEMIKISKSGIVLDGQHRLLAVIKSNTPSYFHIVRGLDDSVFDVLDTGSVRNATDIFKVKGIKNESSIPAIISMYNLLQSGRKKGIQKKDRSTNAMLLDQYFSDELFWSSVGKKTRAWYMSFAKILTPSFIGGFYAHFNKLNKDISDSFMEQLCTGIDVQHNVINQLRNKLMQDKMSPRKMPPTLKMALIIKAWNIYIKGDNIKLLKFDSVRDEFPIALSVPSYKINYPVNKKP